MHVMILGGSNSGPKGGWAAALARIAPEHRIDNKFLGAVGSLFGLLRLLKSRREGAKAPDVIVFEYTLNDSVWLMGKNISIALVQATLHDVVTICARERIAILFLCLAVRPPEPEGEAELSMFMNQFYRSVALSRGAADCLLQADILGGVSQSQYVDWLHIGLEASEAVAQAVAARLNAPIPVPRGAARGRAFYYIDAAEARIEGAATRHTLSCSVFEGPFLELARGGRSLWAAKGRPVAIMLRSTERSGAYRISARGHAIRKNAQSLARDGAPNLMTLHYLAGEFPSASTVAIDMTVSEAELMALPCDLTLMDGPPLKPFAEQTLEINGIMVHRPPTLIRRAIDALIAR